MLQSIEFSLIQKIGGISLIVSYFTLIVSGLYGLKINKVPRKLLIVSMILVTIVILVYVYSYFDKSQYDPGYLYTQ